MECRTPRAWGLAFILQDCNFSACTGAKWRKKRNHDGIPIDGKHWQQHPAFDSLPVPPEGCMLKTLLFWIHCRNITCLRISTKLINSRWSSHHAKFKTTAAPAKPHIPTTYTRNVTRSIFIPSCKLYMNWEHKQVSKVTRPAQKELDDGWPESVEEQGLLLLVWRRNFTNDIYLYILYMKDVL